MRSWRTYAALITSGPCHYVLLYDRAAPVVDYFVCANHVRASKQPPPADRCEILFSIVAARPAPGACFLFGATLLAPTNSPARSSTLARTT